MIVAGAGQMRQLAVPTVTVPDPSACRAIVMPDVSVSVRTGIELNRAAAAHRLRRADGQIAGSADLQRLIGIVEGVGSASRVGDRSPRRRRAVDLQARRSSSQRSAAAARCLTVPFRSSVPPLAITVPLPE